MVEDIEHSLPWRVMTDRVQPPGGFSDLEGERQDEFGENGAVEKLPSRLSLAIRNVSGKSASSLTIGQRFQPSNTDQAI
jgi:hypothetical protein